MGDFVRENLTLIVVAVAMFGVWLLLRTKATRVESDASLGGRVGGGQPTIMEFFSNT